MLKSRLTRHSRRSQPPRPGRGALLAAMVLVLAACSSYPLGMSKEEWAQLTPEEQMAARMKQADLDRANAARRAEQAAARRQKYAALEAAERRRIEEMYRSSRYGDVLECVVEGGVAEFRRGRHAYTPAPFTLARGEVKSVALSAGSRHGKFWARYSPDGLSLNLCYRDPRGHGGRYCVSVNGQSEDFSAGIVRRVSVRKVFRDASVLCAYRPERDMPQTYIRRHNTRVYRVIHNHHYRSRPRRTPVVIHNHYSRPAPAPRTRTVIHEHHYQPPSRQRAHRPAPVEPRRPLVRERRRDYPTYRSPRAPEPERASEPPRDAPRYAAPAETDAGRRASPRPAVPDHARSPEVADPRSAVRRGNAGSPPRRERGRPAEADDGSADEYLTSAPAPGRKRGHGKRRKYDADEDDLPPGRAPDRRSR